MQAGVQFVSASRETRGDEVLVQSSTVTRKAKDKPAATQRDRMCHYSVLSDSQATTQELTFPTRQTLLSCNMTDQAGRLPCAYYQW